MTTALGIIKSAMRKVGALTKTENPSADEAQDGLEMLNDLLSSLSNDSMVIYARYSEDFTLSGGTGSYTIGTGGAFNTARPVKIISAFIRSGDVDYPLDILSDEQYYSIAVKSTSGIPCGLNFSNDYPLGVIKLYPVPDANYQLFILSEKQLSQFTINQTVDLPAGWNRMLIYNLALEMFSEYGQTATQEVKMIADDSRALIKKAIIASRPMRWEPKIEQQGNIYTGWP